MPQNKRNKAMGLALAFASVALSSACSNAGKGDSSNAANSTTIVSDALGADVTKPSRIVITPKAQWLELKGYIVGETNRSALATIPDLGKPGFANLNEGVYDIVLEAKYLGADGKTSPVALRVSGVRVTNGQDTQIREIELKPYLNLSGKVLLTGEASHAGINVNIPGTAYKAVTAADGSYSIADVPAGLHTFDYSYSGYNPGFILSKDYRSDEAVPTVSLTRDSVRLESGVHYLGAVLAANSNAKAVLHLAAPGSMTRFRYGTVENLSSAPWVVLRTSLETTLPLGEHPEIFVQYSLDERQLSPVYSVVFPVEN
jgi:hypothetical protein